MSNVSEYVRKNYVGPDGYHEDCGQAHCCHANHLDSGEWVELALRHPADFPCCVDELDTRPHCKTHLRELEVLVDNTVGCIDCADEKPKGE